MAAVLGLVVLGGGPVELEEDHVGSPGQGEAVTGGLDRADDQLVVGTVGGLECLYGGIPGTVAVAAEDVQS